MDLAFLRRWRTLAAAGTLGLMLASTTLAEHCLKKEPQRPQTSPACEPTWGFHQTCWKRFPPLTACGTCDLCGPAGTGCQHSPCLSHGSQIPAQVADTGWAAGVFPSSEASPFAAGRYGSAPSASMRPIHVFQPQPGSIPDASGSSNASQHFAPTIPSPTPVPAGFPPVPPAANPIPSGPVPQPMPQSRLNAPAGSSMSAQAMSARTISWPAYQSAFSSSSNRLNAPPAPSGMSLPNHRSATRYGNVATATAQRPAVAVLPALFDPRQQTNNSPRTSAGSSRYPVHPTSASQPDPQQMFPASVTVQPRSPTSNQMSPMQPPATSGRYGYAVPDGR